MSADVASEQAIDNADAVWKHIQKAYDIEYAHNLRMSELNIHNATAASMLFQSQLLGGFLMGDAKHTACAAQLSRNGGPIPQNPTVAK